MTKGHLHATRQRDQTEVDSSRGRSAVCRDAAAAERALQIDLTGGAAQRRTQGVGPWGPGPPPSQEQNIKTFILFYFLLFLPIFEIKWPKSEEKLDFGVGGFGPGLGGGPGRRTSLDRMSLWT